MNSVNEQLISIVDTLTDYLLSDRLDQKLVDKKEVHSKEEKVMLTNDLFNAILSKNTTPEQQEMMEKFTQQTIREKKEIVDFVIFNLDGFRYQVKRLPHNYTLYSKYKIPDFSNMPEKFKEPVSDDTETIHSRFIELTGLYPQQNFTTFVDKDRYSSNEFQEFCIGRLTNYYAVVYVSKDLLALCEHFSDAFTAPQLDFIKTHKENSFQQVIGAQKTLESMFSSWKDLLLHKKATADQPFSFNDLDNDAYLEETDTHLMMSQKSQNTLYSYVFEKSTGRYKVWKAALAVKADADDFYYTEMVEDCSNYLEMVQYYLGRSYGPISYPVMVNHDGYFKSAQYYLYHFDDNQHLIYDSFQGFNLQCDDAGNLLEDFRILDGLIVRHNLYE
jgi:hypothetical protein